MFNVDLFDDFINEILSSELTTLEYLILTSPNLDTFCHDFDITRLFLPDDDYSYYSKESFPNVINIFKKKIPKNYFKRF